MCYHLYLQEILYIEPITNLTCGHYESLEKTFELLVPNTEALEKLVSPKFRALGKKPLNLGQSIFVSQKHDNSKIWCCFIKDMNVVVNKKTGLIEEYALLLKLNYWTKERFPFGSSGLCIVPCSTTISRIIKSMPKLKNPSFIKMLKGLRQIRRIRRRKDMKFMKKLKNSTNFMTTFNDAQKRAVKDVLYNKITILQGPPGTGKTSTIYEIILQLFAQGTYPILVVAASNVAVDNIAEKLKKNKELNILRIVSLAKEAEYNERHELNDICLHQHVFNELPEDYKNIVLTMNKDPSLIDEGQHKKLFKKSNPITKKHVLKAHVILTTTVSSSSFAMSYLSKVPVVIMDESTQSSEATTLIPLSMPDVDKLIFVGDDKQLSSFSEVPYLEQSLFERMIKNGTYKNPLMLNQQYRMHPKISEVPMKMFYDGKVFDGVSEEDRFHEAWTNPLLFVNYCEKSLHEKYCEAQVRNSNITNKDVFSYTNKGEANLIIKILQEMICVKGIERDKIGIITPYSAQRDLIAKKIQNDPFINSSKDTISEDVEDGGLVDRKPPTVKTICKIMVSSIDAFQGREKDFIIFSCVRSNSENKIGFVKDARRLNVALTRAKFGLILVGNKECMSKGDPLWSRLIEHLENEDVIVGKNHFKGIVDPKSTKKEDEKNSSKGIVDPKSTKKKVEKNSSKGIVDPKSTKKKKKKKGSSSKSKKQKSTGLDKPETS